MFTAWCQAFLGDVLEATGKYRYQGLHWHAFSYGLVEAESGRAALAAYRSMET